MLPPSEKRRPSRKSMVIYREWIINGVSHEIASAIKFIEAAAMALSLTDRVYGKVLVLSTEFRTPRELPIKADLELLEPAEALQRFKTKTCVVKCFDGSHWIA